MTDLLWPGDHRAGRIFSDGAFLDAMIAVEAAWSSGLIEVGVAPASARVSAEHLRGLAGKVPVEQLSVAAESGGNPVIPLVRTLRDGLGDSAAANWLHRGLTSQDVIDTALMLCAAEAFAQIQADLAEQISVLAHLTVQHRATPMVARTLTQYAVPMTFGLKVTGWLRGILDAHEQLERLEFPAQIGGAAGTLAAVAELAGSLDDPATIAVQAGCATARELGLSSANPWHTVRTSITRCGDAALGCTDAWGHLANDVLTLSRPEIGELSEGAGGGSSTMPHKANPVLSVLIRRAALAAPSLGASLHVSAADALEERSSGAWHVEWETLRTLVRRTVVAGSQASALVTGLQVHGDRMRANIDAAGDAVRSEQRTMAAIAGNAPAAEYLGATDEFIEAELSRAAAVSRGADR
ncbi:lyase family protein [Aldersonia sp. NBC_00410]|uniref:lyase family protein n=1 Tax=Aldersonia sp. NBC_00410 TaxID=2975954 RepID=UPI0022566D7C|nr:lyase family protein [Aldersonia sp. NBC_00410]MCX5044143.1 lyase family protein [Aldersonia sp. NBC_00410]